MKSTLFFFPIFVALFLFCTDAAFSAQSLPASEATGGYVVAVSEKTDADSAWKAIVDQLVKKHHAQLLTWKSDISEIQKPLATSHAKYLGIVAQPEECGVALTRSIYQLTRELNSDPRDHFGGVLWGIITGYTPAAASRLVKTSEAPLVVEKALNTTTVNPADFAQAYWLSDGNPPGTIGEKNADGKVVMSNVGTKLDRLPLFVQHFRSLQPDLLVTSSHANVDVLTIPFQANQGQVRVSDGMPVGIAGALINRLRSQAVSSDGKPKPMGIPADFKLLPFGDSQNPKVFLAAGNCLIGNICNRKSLALAFMNSEGVDQFVGYTIETWFGQAGWGTLGFWERSGGNLTLSEAFFLNNQNVLNDIALGEKGAKKVNLEGLKYDRDVLAFYGDPAWSATFDPKRFPNAITTDFSQNGKVATLRIYIPVGAKDLLGANKPFGFVFPKKIAKPKLLAGQAFKAILGDLFLLVPDTSSWKPDSTVEISWTSDESLTANF